MRTIMALLMLLAGSACAQRDVDGWTKAKWGMSVQEVLKAFEGQAKFTPECDVKPPASRNKTFVLCAFVDDFEIESKYFRVEFRFESTTKKLETVSLEPSQKGYSWERYTEDLERALMEKYGQPAVKKRSVTRLYEDINYSWAFPKTNILLIGGFSHTTQLDSKFLNVIYRMREPEKDKL